MKLTKWFLSVALAGSCLNQASAQLHPSATPSRHIGDSQTTGDDERPHEFQFAASRSISHAMAADNALLAPTSASFMPDLGDNGSCGANCGGSCGTLACGSIGKCKPKPNGWFTAETLLWFGQSQKSPALDAISQAGGLFIPGNQIVSTEFGGADAIATDLLPGYRLSIGRYMGADNEFGVGGRVFGLYSSEQTARSGLLGLETIGQPLVDAGELTARSDLDMVGAEASLFVLLSQSDNHRTDLVGGYTFNRLQNSVALRTQSTNVFTGDAVANGTTFDTNDLFETENVFHGGHLGILSTTVHNRISLSTLAKISFGNMRQSGAISGSTETALGGNSQQFADGILAQGNNIGTFSRDEFAFIPELGLKLGYNFRENMQLTVGYTFLMYSSVFMAGDQMDPSVDLTNGMDNSNLRDTSFWLQGIDLGMTFTF